MKQKLLLLVVILFTTFSFSQTSFTAKIPIASTADTPYNIASGTIDNDGYIDIVVGTYNANTLEVYINNGDGTFATAVNITNTLGGIGGLKLVDLNNDTYLDILATGYSSDSVVWFANDGNGNFGAQQVISSSVNGASGLAVGTIDSGTTLDVAIAAYDSNSVVWFSNDGAGNFTGPNTIINSLTAPGVVNLKDIDGDSDLDALVLTGQYNSNNVINIYKNNGSGAFTDGTVSVSTGEDYLFNGNFVDMDGDANLDILVTELDFTPGNGLLLWFEDNGAGFTRTIIPTSIGNPAVAQLHDLDDDNLKDLIVSSGALADTNDIIWFKNNGSGSFGAEQVISNTQGQPYVYTVADFDNDNDLDIASCDYNQDALNWFENEKYTLSNPSFEKKAISFYPNPTLDKLYFRSNTIENFEISVYDVLGKKVLNTELSIDNSLNVSDLKSGLYIIKFEGLNSTYKFVKK